MQCISHNFREVYNSSRVRIGYNNCPLSIAPSVLMNKVLIQQQQLRPKQREVILIDGILIRC